MASQTQNPFLDWDFNKFADLKAFGAPFAVPSVDTAALIEAQRKNLEAVTAANRAVYAGVQAVAQRQAEILRENVNAAVTAAREISGAGTPQDQLAKQAEVAKASYETAVANWQELAELNVKSGSEVAALINKRVTESLDEVKKAVNGK